MKKRGRPIGSKNKKTMKEEAQKEFVAYLVKKDLKDLKIYDIIRHPDKKGYSVVTDIQKSVWSSNFKVRIRVMAPEDQYYNVQTYSYSELLQDGATRDVLVFKGDLE